MSTHPPRKCPHCGGELKESRSPLVTVDIIIEVPANGGEKGIVLIERKNFPFGWAIPGGFVDYGETVEQAAVREAKEETAMEVHSLRLLGVYSDPSRDPRGHTVSVVFVAKGEGVPKAKDDAKNLRVFAIGQVPKELAFDHAQILADYRRTLAEA